MNLEKNKKSGAFEAGIRAAAVAAAVRLVPGLIGTLRRKIWPRKGGDNNHAGRDHSLMALAGSSTRSGAAAFVAVAVHAWLVARGWNAFAAGALAALAIRIDTVGGT
jgi:hypothetical protein